MSWTHLEDTKPKARKNYWCDICAEKINVGEAHVARRGIGDVGPMTSRMHIECEEMTKKWDLMEWEGHFPGDVRRPVHSANTQGEAQPPTINL
jgi:hypothetical protein